MIKSSREGNYNILADNTPKCKMRMYVQFLLNLREGMRRSLGATSSTSAATYLPRRHATLLMKASVVKPEGPAMSLVPWPYLDEKDKRQTRTWMSEI